MAGPDNSIELFDQKPTDTWHIDRATIIEVAKGLGKKDPESYFDSAKTRKQIEWIINSPIFAEYIKAEDAIADFASQNEAFVKKIEDSKKPDKMLDSSMFGDSRYMEYMSLEVKRMTARVAMAQQKPEFHVFSLLDITTAYVKKAKIILD